MKVKFHYNYPLDININTDKDVDVYIDKIDMSIVPLGNVRIIILEEPCKGDLFTIVQEHRDYYTHLLTFHDEILTTNSKASLFLCMGAWVENYIPPSKKFGVSTVVGGKNNPIMEGYKLRHDLWRNKEIIKIPKSFYLSGNTPNAHEFIRWSEVDYRGQFVLGRSKLPLFDSQFHIAIENTAIKNYFSEKILDCFQSRTVPIYYGCNNIEDYFNTDGIISIHSLDEIVDACNKLTPQTYDMMLPAIEDNFNRSMKWCNHDEQIKIAIVKLLNEIK